MGALAFIKELLPLVIMAVNGIRAAVPLVKEGMDRVTAMVTEGRDPTADDWAWLNGSIAEFRRKLHSDTE